MPRQTRPKNAVVALTLLQSKALLSACTNLKDRVIIQLLLQTGSRLVELHRLNCADFTVTNNTITAQTQPKGHTKKDHTIYISADLYSSIVQLCAKNAQNCLFEGRDGRCLTVRALEYRITKLYDKIGINGHIAHDLRNTAGVLALQAGASMEDVQKMYGHKNIGLTAYYCRDWLRAQRAKNNAESRIANLLNI